MLPKLLARESASTPYTLAGWIAAGVAVGLMARSDLSVAAGALGGALAGLVSLWLADGVRTGQRAMDVIAPGFGTYGGFLQNDSAAALAFAIARSELVVLVVAAASAWSSRTAAQAS
jgi:hypothetical protein